MALPKTTCPPHKFSPSGAWTRSAPIGVPGETLTDTRPLECATCGAIGREARPSELGDEHQELTAGDGSEA